MTRTPVVQVVLLVVGALATSWLIVGVVFNVTRGTLGSPRGADVAVGLALGLLVGLMVTRVTRRAAGAAAALLLALAVLDWTVHWPFGPVGWLSASMYVWLAIAVLAVRGLVSPRAE